MKNTLIVYYSQSGVTRKVARELAHLHSCDLEEIHDRKPRRIGLRGFVKSSFEAVTKRTPRIEDLFFKPENYEHVVIGSPVWAGQMTPPIRSFLKKYGENIEKVSFFCTYGGSGGIKVLREMAILCGQSEYSSFAFTAEILEDKKYFQTQLDEFVKSWPKAQRNPGETLNKIAEGKHSASAEAS